MMAAAELFRDYWNNFLTVKAFAAHHQMKPKEAADIIAKGREEHDKEADALKGGSDEN